MECVELVQLLCVLRAGETGGHQADHSLQSAGRETVRVSESGQQGLSPAFLSVTLCLGTVEQLGMLRNYINIIRHKYLIFQSSRVRMMLMVGLQSVAGREMSSGPGTSPGRRRMAGRSVLGRSTV